MAGADDAHIQFGERCLGTPAQFGCGSGIVDDAPKAVGRTAEHTVKIDRLQVRFGRPLGERILIQIEVKHRGFEIGHAPLKSGMRGQRQTSFDFKSKDQARKFGLAAQALVEIGKRTFVVEPHWAGDPAIVLMEWPFRSSDGKRKKAVKIFIRASY